MVALEPETQELMKNMMRGKLEPRVILAFFSVSPHCEFVLEN